MLKNSISILAKRFGNVGRRIWYMCQGADPDPVHRVAANPKSMGHGKVMPLTRQAKLLLNRFLLICAKNSVHDYVITTFVRSTFLQGCSIMIWDGWDLRRCIQATSDSKDIFQLASFLIMQHWQGEPVSQIQVTALDPMDSGFQTDFFEKNDPKREQLYSVIDQINDRYGEFTIAPLPMLHRSKMPNVISPAWKPYGHRQTI